MNIKLLHAFELFICDRETFCSPKTILYYRKNIIFFLTFLQEVYEKLPGELSLDEISPKIFSQYVRYLRNKNKFTVHPFVDVKDVKLKNTTIRTYCRAVKAFLNYCNLEFDTVFVTLVKMPKDDSEEKIPLYENEVEEIDKLFNLKSITGVRNYCIFHLMLDAGLRSDEVVHLRICDVLFDKNIIKIVNAKGNKSRVVLLCPKLKKQLYLYLYFYRTFHSQEPYDQQQFFVKIRSNEFINYNCIKQMFAKLKVQSNISRLTPHLLRHTFATSYIIGGGNLENLRLLLGHYDYSVTRIYLHLANTYKLMGASIYKLDPLYFRSGY